MAKHTLTIRWLLPTNCWSVFDHFVGLALEGLIREWTHLRIYLLFLHLSIMSDVTFKRIYLTTDINEHFNDCCLTYINLEIVYIVI